MMKKRTTSLSRENITFVQQISQKASDLQISLGCKRPGLEDITERYLGLLEATAYQLGEAIYSHDPKKLREEKIKKALSENHWAYTLHAKSGVKGETWEKAKADALALEFGKDKALTQLLKKANFPNTTTAYVLAYETEDSTLSASFSLACFAALLDTHHATESPSVKKLQTRSYPFIKDYGICIEQKHAGQATISENWHPIAYALYTDNAVLLEMMLDHFLPEYDSPKALETAEIYGEYKTTGSKSSDNKKTEVIQKITLAELYNPKRHPRCAKILDQKGVIALPQDAEPDRIAIQPDKTKRESKRKCTRRPRIDSPPETFSDLWEPAWIYDRINALLAREAG